MPWKPSRSHYERTLLQIPVCIKKNKSPMSLSASFILHLSMWICFWLLKLGMTSFPCCLPDLAHLFPPPKDCNLCSSVPLFRLLKIAMSVPFFSEKLSILVLHRHIYIDPLLCVLWVAEDVGVNSLTVVLWVGINLI